MGLSILPTLVKCRKEEYNQLYYSISTLINLSTKVDEDEAQHQGLHKPPLAGIQSYYWLAFYLRLMAFALL